MNECRIKLQDSDEVKVFVSAAERCEFDVDIFCNHMVVDAKSMLGVMGFDLAQPLTVRFDGENEEFNEVLERFACED